MVDDLAPGHRFAGRTAIVTGGGRGIGRAIALALAREGANVGVVARSHDQCEQVASLIGRRGLALSCDVCDATDCASALSKLEGRFGRVSLLVNAAGISPVRGPAERQRVSDFASIVAINLVGAFTMAHATYDSLAAGGGTVVNVASTLGVAASPLLSAYGASKAALIQLTRTLAREWADAGIRVNALCPGYVETDLTKKLLADERSRDLILGATPLGRLAEMAEVVAPALFLASDDASYITGAALIVDGGFAA
jgi:NAD(P)-dependent dehydrogenase (short-subunit alcohol dehydrogenase family)